MIEQTSEAWRTYFLRNGYQPMIKVDTNDTRRLSIEEFSNEDDTVPEELREIFLLCSESDVPCELLLVLDIRDGRVDDDGIKTLCDAWDERILSFLNFGALPDREKQSLYLLKYNVMQIILSDALTTRCTVAMSEEKSTDISRKLFITIENSDVVETDRSMLPFYFDQLMVKSTAPESEHELADMLPQSDNLKFLYRADIMEKVFLEEDLAAIKEWLSNAKD